MAEDDEKSKSVIHQKLEEFKINFDKKYNEEKSSESSTSPFLSSHGYLSTNDGSSPSKGVRPKTSRVETFSEHPKPTIHGFDNETLFLKNFLLKRKESKEFKTLAVVGKYGVGKTTLCQDVFNDQEVKLAYFPRLWVSMYVEKTEEDKDPKVAVLKRILRSLGVDDDMFDYIKAEAKDEKGRKDEAGETEEETVKEKELSKLLYVLNLNLIGKKYLIVLDNVWKDNEWNQKLDDKKNQHEKLHLSRGFPKESGGRVIVTSREESFVKNIVGEEEENLLRLFPISDAESVLKIYSDAVMKVTGKEVIPKYPGRFKQELMDKSCGIPLAALMLAQKKKPVKMDETKPVKMDETKSSL